ncbi:MAG: hypothetical protein CM15mP122_5790 [Bacteroidota bacterium]|nr:MAG: hypothetical protein CM15mP122_5790 [Bacteroidota bacterium]
MLNGVFSEEGVISPVVALGDIVDSCQYNSSICIKILCSFYLICTSHVNVFDIQLYAQAACVALSWGVI